MNTIVVLDEYGKIAEKRVYRGRSMFLEDIKDTERRYKGRFSKAEIEGHGADEMTITIFTEDKAHYGVNVGKLENGRLSYVRYLTFERKDEAKRVYEVLKLGNEARLWDSVEIERITENENGGFEYETIAKAMVG